MKFDDKQDIFLSVIELHKGIIYKVANSYCNAYEDRKDMVQEIILQLWKSFDKYDNQFKHSTWIYRIALNVAISSYRTKSKRKEMYDPLSEGILNITDIPNNDRQEEGVSFLHQFIAELKELDKALMLLYLEERSHKEMAEIMGMTETNVATKIGRIKTILRSRFLQVKI